MVMSGAGPARRRKRFRASFFFGSAFFRAGQRPPMLLPIGPLSVFPPPVGACRPISFEKSIFFRLLRPATRGSAALRFRYGCHSVALLVLRVFGRFGPVSGRPRPRAGPSTDIFLQKFFFGGSRSFAADCARAAFRFWADSRFSGRPAPRAPSERKTPRKNFARVLSFSTAGFSPPAGGDSRISSGRADGRHGRAPPSSRKRPPENSREFCPCRTPDFGVPGKAVYVFFRPRG